MPGEIRRGIISLRDERHAEFLREQLIDVIQLNDTYKSQPRDNEGQFIHTAPDGRIHVDVYLGPHKKDEADVRITGSIAFSGALTSGTSLSLTSGQAFGFAGLICGMSGTTGTVYAVLSDSSLILSSYDEVCGTIFVGSTLGRSSPFILSGL
jgi:hypothetical protein